MQYARKALVPLKDVLSALLKAGASRSRPPEVRIGALWDEVAGPTLARFARPSRLLRGRLKVLVSDPIWLQECRFAEARLRTELNARLGSVLIQALDFELGA